VSGFGLAMSTPVTAAVAVVCVLVVVHGYLLWRIYARMGEPGWRGIVPLLNAHVVFRRRGREWWWVLLLLVPCVGWLVAIVYLNDLARLYGRSAAFTVGLVLVPVVFLGVLAFGHRPDAGPVGHVA
jgi:Family of unknown function (DUF5684)